jgi:hypothetical protein
VNYPGPYTLEYPDVRDEGWNAAMERNLTRLAASLLGNFAVVPAELPSASLNVVVRGGVYANASGALTTVAAPGTVAIPTSATWYLYLTAAGVFTVGPSWPAPGAGRFVPLAIVTTSGTVVTSITDARLPLMLVGS